MRLEIRKIFSQEFLPHMHQDMGNQVEGLQGRSMEVLLKGIIRLLRNRDRCIHTESLVQQILLYQHLHMISRALMDDRYRCRVSFPLQTLNSDMKITTFITVAIKGQQEQVVAGF